MNYKKAKELLKKASYILKTHKERMRELDKHEDDLCDSKSSNVNDSIRIIQKNIEDAKREQLTLYNEANKVLRIINRIDSNNADVLKQLYMDGKRLKDVQLSTGYSQSSVCRFRDEGLKQFCIKYNKLNEKLLGFDLTEEA